MLNFLYIRQKKTKKPYLDPDGFISCDQRTKIKLRKFNKNTFFSVGTLNLGPTDMDFFQVAADSDNFVFGLVMLTTVKA